MTHSIYLELTTPNTPKEDRLYLENIDNDEFLDYVLEHNLVDGLKREEVSYVDNWVSDTKHMRASFKIILTKDGYYVIGSAASTLQGFRERRVAFCKKYEQYCNVKYKYVTPDKITSTHIKKGTSAPCEGVNSYAKCDELWIITTKRKREWWDLKPSREERVRSRYNDIYKIKSIIDERVAYWLAEEENDK